MRQVWNTATKLPKPVDWAKAAVQSSGGWQHAYSIAVSCSREFLGKDTDVKNPLYDYWMEARKWIKTNAPLGELKEEEQQ
jgi:hypothetical protein